MSGWGGGYVTDINYIAGFHASQSQTLMALAALLNGFAARPIRRDEPLHFCDIGCGVGITALIIAAANPAWHITGLDFNPAHIATATALARDAGIENATFLEVDLRSFAETAEARALAPFDVVSAHGVWSWVDETVQDGILRLLNARLKPGGMFQVSYNLLTGWQMALGLQRLVREAGTRLAGRSDRQAEAGLKIAQSLADAEGRTSYDVGFGKEMLAQFQTLPIGYVAHELMNENWRPLLQADVAARLAAAKLEFAGSTRMLNNFPQLTLTAAQRQVLDSFDDPLITELFKDICHPVPLRTDVYLRGGRRIDNIARDQALRDIVLAITVEEQAWKFEFEAGEGMAQMAPAYYRPIFQRLTKGPASVGELLALPDLQGRRDNPAELLGVLLGTEQAAALPNHGTNMDERCARLNNVLLRAQYAAGQGAGPISFALPALGHGMILPNFEGMIIHELAMNPHETNPRDMAARLAIHQDQATREALATRLTNFQTLDAPILRHVGFAV